jgi:hypothetical protein
MLSVIALGLLAGSGRAAPRAADPIVGKWRATRGGSGTVAISRRAGSFAIDAASSVTLGCVASGAGNLVGFVELPSSTALPPGRYNGTFGNPGQGCSYNVALALAGGTLTGTVTYSEDGVPAGPFTFVKTGTTKYRWSVKTKTISGSGTVTATAQGGVTAAAGTLSTARWKLAARAPGKLTVSPNGKFTLSLAVKVTKGVCSDRTGSLTLSNGRARLASVCGGTLTGSGAVEVG